jgi:hypothetical protein
METDVLIKQLQRLQKKTCFIYKITEDNLSETLLIMLENYPNLLKNELPEIHRNLVITVNLDNI